MTEVDSDRTGTPAQIRAVPVRHPGRWVATAVLLVLVAMAVHTLAFSHVMRGKSMQSRFGWHVVGQYFFSRIVLDGLVVTLELTAIAMAIGIGGGVLLAVMRLSENPIVRWVAWGYIWFFRGTPVYVQLIFWYVGLVYLYPRLSLGIPFGPEWVHVDANHITAFILAFVGLGLNEAAYMSEIVRAGIISVDEGQSEAAQALGMSRLRTLRRIVLPQAMRVIVPPTGNETISMLKTTSLVSVMAVAELLYSVQLVYASTYQIVPMLLVAVFWYLIVTSILTMGQFYVERYFGRGSARAEPPTPIQRLRRMLRSHPDVAPLGATAVDSLPAGNQRFWGRG